MKKKFLIYGLIFIAGYAFIKFGSVGSNNKRFEKDNQERDSQNIISKTANLTAIIKKENSNETIVSKEFDPLSSENKKFFDSHPLNKRSPEFIAPEAQQIKKPERNLGAFEKKLVDVLSKFATTENGTKIIDKLFAPLILNNEINKDPYSNLSIELVEEGSGKVARCGDYATVHYLLKDQNGLTLANTKISTPENIHIGFSSNGNKGIDYSLIGMKENGVKRVILPRSQMKEIKAQSNFFALEIELLKIKSNLPSFNQLKSINLFDQTKATSNFKHYRCGDMVNVKYIIKNIRGKVLHSANEFITFKIGQQDVPYIFNLMAEGMFPSSIRTAIVPYDAYLAANNIDNYASKFHLLPKEDLSIIEIQTGA